MIKHYISLFSKIGEKTCFFVFCFRLWNRYCISRTNTLNYKEFLQYLGISLEKKKKKMAEKVIDSGRHLKGVEGSSIKATFHCYKVWFLQLVYNRGLCYKVGNIKQPHTL